MQKINRDVLIEKATKLLTDGTVSRVLGWKKGDLSYDITPAVFTDPKELQEEFVFNDFCGANFSKYLLKETRKDEGKILIFLKPCDTYSFNQLLTEHRFDREKVYAVGISCEGMIDINKIKLAVGDLWISQMKILTEQSGIQKKKLRLCLKSIQTIKENDNSQRKKELKECLTRSCINRLAIQSVLAFSITYLRNCMRLCLICSTI